MFPEKEIVAQSIARMNELGRQSRPFLFIIDFLWQQPLVIPLNSIDPQSIQFNINGLSNQIESPLAPPKINLKKQALSFQSYKKSFDKVMAHLKYGNTFLVNLTCPTTIECNLSLYYIYIYSMAKYKLWLKNQFVVFSPESFVRIKQGYIYSYPMKGTIAADLPNAQHKILTDKKEAAEHATIVDLIRNDLSQVAKQITVEKYRYIEEVITNENKLLQVSSCISGRLDFDYKNNIGHILEYLLPAGSISGAPKAKTIEIIKEAENYQRKYYTGIFGYFDGENLDSAVMIRFIENTSQGLIYKSGGGITAMSQARNEYNELIDKVYIPIY